MMIMDKPVVRAEVQSWIGRDPMAKHFHGYITNTETGKEHETQLEYFDEEAAARGCVALFTEFYSLHTHILIFCSRAAFCTI